MVEYHSECQPSALRIIARVGDQTAGEFELAGDADSPMLVGTGDGKDCSGVAWHQTKELGRAVYPHTISMSIEVEDEFKGLGIGKALVAEMVEKLDALGCPSDQTFHIDTDASWEENSKGELVSFWDYIGMRIKPVHVDHPVSRTMTRDLPGSGYEKSITLEELRRTIRTRGWAPQSKRRKLRGGSRRFKKRYKSKARAKRSRRYGGEITRRISPKGGPKHVPNRTQNRAKARMLRSEENALTAALLTLPPTGKRATKALRRLASIRKERSATIRRLLKMSDATRRLMN